jgi:hypothetical protein
VSFNRENWFFFGEGKQFESLLRVEEHGLLRGSKTGTEVMSGILEINLD